MATENANSVMLCPDRFSTWRSPRRTTLKPLPICAKRLQSLLLKEDFTLLHVEHRGSYHREHGMGIVPTVRKHLTRCMVKTKYFRCSFHHRAVKCTWTSFPLESATNFYMIKCCRLPAKKLLYDRVSGSRLKVRE